jgi:T5SS/PEP-CTERM-associated repeat protein
MSLLERALNSSIHCVLLLAGCLASTVVLAQSQWNGQSSNSWFDFRNWTPLGVPNSGNVDIDVVEPFSAVVFAASTGNLGLLQVGVANEGSLFVDGGTVNSVDGFIAIEEGSTGYVTLVGADSNWNVSSRIRVGNRGEGWLTIYEGASVSSNTSTIGLFETSLGRVEVTGPGSTWDSGNQLVIGWGAQGIMRVDNGAQVSSVNSWVGQDGGFAVAGLAGPGSTWNSSGYLTVGNTGAFGEVNVQSEAELSSDQARVGLSGGQGRVSLQFGPAAWSNSGDVMIGSSGNGTVEIDPPSQMLVGGSVTVGENADSRGRLLVGGELQAGGSVAIQENGELLGKGTIEAAVVVNNGGMLAPGRDFVFQGGIHPGTLTMASLELHPGAALEFELDVPDVAGSEINDLVIVNGDFTLDGVVNVIDAGRFESGTYTLATYTGTLTDNGLTVGSLPDGFMAEVDTTVAGQVRLIVTSERIFRDQFDVQ